MRTLCRVLHSCLTALLLAVLTTPCYAVIRPVTTPVDSIDAFLVEYGRKSDSNSVREYFARGPLLCTGDVALTGGMGWVYLVALGGVRVTSGAVVHWDDPELMISGPPPCITVERGGILRIQRWHPMMSNGAMPTAGMIRVEAGGVLQVAEGVTLPEGMVIVEKDTPPSTLLPPSAAPEPEPTPEPTPEPEPAQIPIESLYEAIPQVESATGQGSVEMALPNTVLVRLSHEAGDLETLAVQWDLSGVRFDTPGTYTVYGDFIPDGLTFHGISNPKGLRPMVSLTILATTPVQDLAWTVTEPVSNGSALVRLDFLSLPKDVTHLYLQRSTDGVRWSRCTSRSRSQDTDLLSDVTTRNGISSLTSHQLMEPSGFYLRLEVVGSPREGTSNILYIHTLADGEDGKSEGNRGGIQGTFDRKGQKESEETSTAPETGTETESLQEELPEQAEAQKTNPEKGPLEQETDISGSTSQWSGYDREQTMPLPLIHNEYSFAKESVSESPQPSTEEVVPKALQQSAKAATLPEETEEAQPTRDKDLPTTTQPPAVESNSPTPQGDGDTNGFVAAVTLAVCLFSATGLYLRHQRSIKRKS